MEIRKIIKFRFRNSTRGWLLKELVDFQTGVEYVVAPRDQNLSDFPPFFKNLFSSHRRGRRDRLTITSELGSGQLEHFWQNNRFQINDNPLDLKNIQNNFQQERLINRDRQRRINQLRFRNGLEDPGVFQTNFLDLFSNDEETGRLQLFIYLKPEHRDEFERLYRENATLNLMVQRFYVIYREEYDTYQRRIRNVSLENHNGNIRTFVMELDQFFRDNHPGLTFRARVFHIQKRLPDNLRNALEQCKSPSLLCNLERLINFLNAHRERAIVQVQPNQLDAIQELQQRFNRPNI